MPATDRPAEADLQPLLEPLLSLDGPEANTLMGQTIGEALKLPGARDVLRRAKDPQRIGRLLEDTAKWIKTVVKPEWLPPDLDQQLFAVPQALALEDAFIGAWEIDETVVQVAVTKERVHLVTRMGDTPVAGSESKKLAAAVAFAERVLQLPEPLKSEAFSPRAFAGCAMATRQVDTAAQWYDTLLIVTDGVGVKYSVLKLKDKSSPNERESAKRVVVPWFPQDP